MLQHTIHFALFVFILAIVKEEAIVKVEPTIPETPAPVYGAPIIPETPAPVYGAPIIPETPAPVYGARKKIFQFFLTSFLDILINLIIE